MRLILLPCEAGLADLEFQSEASYAENHRQLNDSTNGSYILQKQQFFHTGHVYFHRGQPMKMISHR